MRLAEEAPRSAAVRVMNRHVYQDRNRDGFCSVCRLADPERRNRVHQLPDVPEHVEHLRRAGERV